MNNTAKRHARHRRNAKASATAKLAALAHERSTSWRQRGHLAVLTTAKQIGRKGRLIYSSKHGPAKRLSEAETAELLAKIQAAADAEEAEP